LFEFAGKPISLQASGSTALLAGTTARSFSALAGLPGQYFRGSTALSPGAVLPLATTRPLPLEVLLLAVKLQSLSGSRVVLGR
jgi:hypothetical protein